MNYFIFFNYLSLAFFLGFGTFIVVKDLKYKKIKNSFIVLGLLIYLTIIFLVYFLNIVNLIYLKNVFINTGISLFVGFIIWRLGFWPAGDAKFFFLCSFLLPLYYYKNNYLEYFPSFVLLLNSFFAFFAFYAIKSFFFFFVIFINKIKNKKINIRMIIDYIIIRINEKTSNFFLKRNFFIFLKKILLIITGIFIYFAAMKFLFKSQFNIKFLFIYLFIFAIIGWLMNFYFNKISKSKININDLKEGMNLSEESVSEIKKAGFFDDLGVLRAEGINHWQSDLIKLHLSEKNINIIYVQRYIPFAVWIFTGSILTIFLKGDIIKAIYNFIDF